VPPFVGTQAPSVHATWPVGQLVAQASLAHIWSAPHIVSQLPQCAALDATQFDPQASRPLVQVHCPFVQAWPIAQTFPHVPQFNESLATLVQTPPHIVWPPLQLAPVPPVPGLPPMPTFPVHAPARRDSPARNGKRRRLIRDLISFIRLSLLARPARDQHSDR
jgi:hypothetical protein